MLAISSRGYELIPAVCVYYQCTCRYSSTVWYWNNSGPESDFISDQNWMSLRKNDQTIQWLHVDFNLSKL